MKIPLEDNASDIISKALSGLSITPAALAARCGIRPADVEKAIENPGKSPHLRVIAPALGLDAGRLQALADGAYLPKPVVMDGVALFNTPYDDMTVNAFLVWEPTSLIGAVLDTGSDCDGILEFAEENEIQIATVFITHAHGDHIFDLDRLVEKTGAAVYTPEKELVDGANSFAAGKEFTVGGLEVATRLTCGHSVGGVTYVISGLETTVAICGDAVFAGSMGGGRVSYSDALRTNRDEILSLSDDTILCPGHGPMTTVGEERVNNPFFP